MEKAYTIKCYVRDVENYSNDIMTEDIHENLWDIITDVVIATNPNDTMSTSNRDFSKMLYDNAEFDTDGFCAIVGDTRITATRTNVEIPKPKETISEPVLTETTLLRCLMSADQYHEITKSIVALTDKSHTDFRLTITPYGFDVMHVDPANVALVMLDYQKDAFEMYSAPASTEIGLDSRVLKTFGKIVKRGMVVSLKVTQTGKKINYSLSCDGNEQKGECIDINTMRRKPNAPILTLDTHITVDAKTWIDTIKSAKDAGDKIRLVSNENEFLAVVDNGLSKFQKSIPFIGRSGPSAISLFSLDYLIDIVKAIQNKKEILEITLKTDMPIMITMEGNNRKVSFLLAPRIEAN